MRRSLKIVFGSILLAPFVLAGLWLYQLYRGIDEHIDVRGAPPFRIAVTDPLCNRLAADYLKNQDLRDYTPLGVFLEGRLGRPVEVLYGRTLGEVRQSAEGAIDVIIGKACAVAFDAAEVKEPVRAVARLTDSQGDPEVEGLFVVREKSPAKTLGDLADHRILFGPVRDDERHAQALAVLAENGVAPVPPLQIVADCAEALAMVAKGDADVAVVPSYARSLVDGFSGVEKGTLRVVGRTPGQPFVAAFATSRVSPATEQTIRDALMSAREDPHLLAALASKSGFEALTQPAETPPSPPWPAPRRNGRTGVGRVEAASARTFRPSCLRRPDCCGNDG